MGEAEQAAGQAVRLPIISDLYINTPNLKIDILRDQAATYGVSRDADRDAAPQRLQPELRLPDQEADGPVPGDPGGRRRRPRRSPEDLSKLYIKQRRRQAAWSRSSAVATWEPALGPQSVNHLNQFTSVTFNFNLMPGVPIGEATNFIEEAPPRTSCPPTVRGEFQGEALTFRDTVGEPDDPDGRWPCSSCT